MNEMGTQLEYNHNDGAQRDDLIEDLVCFYLGLIKMSNMHICLIFIKNLILRLSFCVNVISFSHIFVKYYDYYMIREILKYTVFMLNCLNVILKYSKITCDLFKKIKLHRLLLVHGVMRYLLYAMLIW